jgi:hypothetical protein
MTYIGFQEIDADTGQIPPLLRTHCVSCVARIYSLQLTMKPIESRGKAKNFMELTFEINQKQIKGEVLN